MSYITTTVPVGQAWPEHVGHDIALCLQGTHEYPLRSVLVARDNELFWVEAEDYDTECDATDTDRSWFVCRTCHEELGDPSVQLIEEPE